MKKDVERLSVLRAAGLKIAAYRVLDSETDEYSSIQFHATYQDTVLAVMGEESAKLFARFIHSTLEGIESSKGLAASGLGEKT